MEEEARDAGRPETVHSAEQGERGAVEESGEDESAAFETSAYWDEFYGDDDDLFDWYSSEHFLVDLITSIAQQLHPDDPSTTRILDIGCGTCPILFTLAEEHGFTNLVGVDFSTSAIALNKSTADERGVSNAISFHTSDALSAATHVEHHSFDIVLDKGCLDCFISSKTGNALSRLARYLQEVETLLSPSGKYVLVPVNASDIPRLLGSGVVALDPFAQSPAARNAPEEGGAFHRDEASTSWQQRFRISEVRGRDDKHIFVCTAGTGSPPSSLLCDVCGKSFPYPDKVPKECPTCSNHLQRFALS